MLFLGTARGRALAAALAIGLLAGNAFGQLNSDFNEQEQRWTLSTSVLRATFVLTEDGEFGLAELRSTWANRDRAMDAVWTAPEGSPSSPIALRTGSESYGPDTRWVLIQHSKRGIARQGLRQTIVLEDVARTARFTVELEVFRDQPALRYRVIFQNRLAYAVRVVDAGALPWRLAAPDEAYQAMTVNQWVAGGHRGNFEPHAGPLRRGEALDLFSGAYGQQCSWLAVRDSVDNGLFFGWEFDGRLGAKIEWKGQPGVLALSSSIPELYRLVAAQGQFSVPAGFLGVFRGDWDEAAYRTQRFVEAAIAAPMADADFPYVIWDSWRYTTDFDEKVLHANAEIAAKLGVEVFVVDLGWAVRIGDWTEDPEKFPSGLRALSDHVHSLGMKFGLHFPLAEAAPDSAVLRENPDWTSSMDYGYFSARSLCLGHRPVRTWVVEQALRIIDTYNVDWILQDGENMVKHCTKRSHTHHLSDSNWANTVDGLNWIVSSIQTQRPNVHWENCEDGGNMMTYAMTRRYVTSIAADDSGELITRQAIYGVTYPFPPRYSDRYMPHSWFNEYITRSYMFGGPWILMNRLPEVDEPRLELAKREIELFKQLRGRIRNGKVLHLTARPDNHRVDAIGSYDPVSDSTVAFVYRPEYSGERVFDLKVPGLGAATRYRVRFQDDSKIFQFTGAEIADKGIPVLLPREFTAEIVYIEPVGN